MRKQFYIKPICNGYEFSNLMHIQSKFGFVTNKLTGRYVSLSINIDDARAKFIESFCLYSRQRQAEGCIITCDDIVMVTIENSCEVTEKFNSEMIEINGVKMVSEF